MLRLTWASGLRWVKAHRRDICTQSRGSGRSFWWRASPKAIAAKGSTRVRVVGGAQKGQPH